MMIKNYLIEIFSTIIEWQTLIAAIIAAIASLFISCIFNKKLEHAKHDLQRDLVGYQTKYSSFYNKQISVIENLHEKLTKAWLSLQDHLLATDNLLKETEFFSNQTEELLQESKLFYETNKLYFDDSMCTSIDSLIKSISNASISLKHGYRPPILTQDEIESQLVSEARKDIREKIPIIRNELREQFRDALWPESKKKIYRKMKDRSEVERLCL